MPKCHFLEYLSQGTMRCNSAPGWSSGSPAAPQTFLLILASYSPSITIPGTRFFPYLELQINMQAISYTHSLCYLQEDIFKYCLVTSKHPYDTLHTPLIDFGCHHVKRSMILLTVCEVISSIIPEAKLGDFTNTEHSALLYLSITCNCKCC